MTRRRKWRVFVLFGLFCFIWFGKAAALRGHRLSFVPPAMNASRILYAAEKAWGFGPGGNETGIIVYAMPEKTRRRIEAEGAAWLETLEGSGRDWHGAYREWHATPFDPNVAGAINIWSVDERADRCGHGAGIAAYMFRYGFCIPIDHDVEAMANRALAAEGSFYAFGRIGMLLLIPSENRIIYAYNG